MNDTLYMRRCFDLARLGAGAVSPNPMVGAVLVHEGRIIGEGWHQKYGEAHAEVNCVRSVLPADRALIPHSTLYCSLEPCFHYGKTPPCVDLILKEKIRRVVVANVDPNPKVAGQSMLKLQAAGVETVAGLLESEGAGLNRAFFTWINCKRPYVILKWAQSADGFLGRRGQRTAISGPAIQRLVHRWRSESDAILVGAETALIDNPRLDARHYFGKKPLRIAFDRQGRLPANSHLLDDTADTWIFGPARPGDYARTTFIPAADRVPVAGLAERLREANRAILLVEGGAEVLSQFLDSGLYDEIRVIENPQRLGSGVAAPGVPGDAVLQEQYGVGEDWVRVYM
jgi:diaminohydroxyphosphoribosylaminopyrimidine deaminase/5-amino-6-(5-phosphoribosylamino)uracil reductase